MPVPTTPAMLPSVLLRDQVFFALQDAIVSGELAPGAVLSDKDLQERLGASRTPIREALNRLANLGLVDVAPQRGTRVADLDLPRFREITEVIGAMYAATVLEAVPLLTPEDRDRIRQIGAELQQGGTMRQQARLTDDLFLLILERYGNRATLRLRERFAPHVERTLAHLDSGELAEDSSPELHRFVEAVVAGEAGDASDATQAFFAGLQVPSAIAAPASGARESAPTSSTRRRLLRDEIYDTILAAIIDGTLEPGEILHDEALINWLGASRTPIREALGRLAEDSVVELVPQRHTRVAPIDARAINEAMFATGVIHEYSARQVVNSLTDAQLHELRDLLEQAMAAYERSDVVRLSRLIRDFFLVFERATSNQVLVETVESLSLQLIRFLTPREGMSTASDILRELERVSAAAHKRDARRVGRLIHDLYEPTRTNFLTTFRGQEA